MKIEHVALYVNDLEEAREFALRSKSIRGLGYNWTTDTIEYVIGLKSGDIDD